MFSRSTAILYFLAVFLCLFVWILEAVSPASFHHRPESVDLVFPSLSSTNLYDIVLCSGKYRLSIRRDSLGWNCVYSIGSQSVIEDEADDLQMKELISELVHLKSLKSPQRMTKSPDYYGLGILSSHGDSIQISYGTIKHRLSMGAAQSSTFQVYAQLDETPFLLVLDGKIHRWIRNIRDNPDAMRQKKIFSLKSKEIPEKIFWQNPQGEKAIFFQESQEWYLQDRKSQQDRANPEVLERLLAWMKQASIQQFLYEPAPEPKSLGDFFMLGYQEGQREEYFLLGKRIATGSQEAFYCARAFHHKNELKISYTYLISAKSGEQIPTTFSQFRDPQILRFPKAKVCKIKREGQISWSLSKEKGQWKLTEPKTQEIQGQKVEEFLERLVSLHTDSFLEGKTEKAKTESLTLISDSGNTQSLSWYISQDKIIIYQENSQIGRILSQQEKNPLKENHFIFYNNRIDAFVFSQVCAIKLNKPGASYELEKKDDAWWILSPSLQSGNTQNIENILRNSAWIMAQGVLGEGEEARKQYQCGQKYSLEITTLTPEKKVCRMELGQEVEKSSHALWVSGFPYVYKISNDLKQSMEKPLD